MRGVRSSLGGRARTLVGKMNYFSTLRMEAICYWGRGTFLEVDWWEDAALHQYDLVATIK